MLDETISEHVIICFLRVCFKHSDLLVRTKIQLSPKNFVAKVNKSCYWLGDCTLCKGTQEVSRVAVGV